MTSLHVIFFCYINKNRPRHLYAACLQDASPRTPYQLLIVKKLLMLVLTSNTENTEKNVCGRAELEPVSLRNHFI